MVATTIRRWLAFALLVAVVVALAIGFSPNDSRSSVSVDTGPPASGTLFPVSQPGPERLAAGEAEAIIALGNTGAGPPADHTGHSASDPVPTVPLSAADAAVFDRQWRAAQQAIPGFDTLAKASALGYVRAAAPAGGIGTHWVLWSQIAKPFDPAKPSMLLFDERKDPAVLVGYSYALQSPTRPEGFAGPNDHWHQHQGLCVVNGWVVREQTSGPDACSGTYIAGGDFWMLHAWVVPKWDNRKGMFAPFNPSLCPPIVGTPDVNRCPD
ncbi:MAG: hypothetical protein ACXVLX_10055 [Ilumatobacteraceae bacterium]